MATDMRDAFFSSLYSEARKNELIIFLTGDHGAFILKEFSEELPDQFFNLGIAEQNMVSVAAGLAKEGRIPYVYGIAPFISLRALEQITVDVCANELSVNFVVVGGGFTYSTDGPTHHGLQDLAVMSSIPGMTILNSSDPANTSDFVRQSLSAGGPHYIRVEKESLEDIERADSFGRSMEIGYSRILANPAAATAIVSTGLMTKVAIEIASMLGKDSRHHIDVVDVHRICPFPDSLSDVLARYSAVYVLEDSYRSVIAREISLLSSLGGRHIELKGVFDAGSTFYFEGDTRDSMHAHAGLATKFVGDSILQIEGVS